MNILIDGNFPIKILPGIKQIMLQVFLPILFFPQMLEFLSLWLKEPDQASFHQQNPEGRP